MNISFMANIPEQEKIPPMPKPKPEESVIKTVPPKYKKKDAAVDHPNHYKRENAIECWDEMEMYFGTEELMIFCKLNCFKYRYRAYDKNGYQDLKKSDEYSRKYAELKEKLEHERTRND